MVRRSFHGMPQVSRLPLSPPWQAAAAGRAPPVVYPLKAVLVDAGLVPLSRDRFGRSTPCRLARGAASGRARFGLHNGRVGADGIPADWILSRALAERRLADPLVNPAQRSFEVLLRAVPAATGRTDGVPNPRLAVARVGPWAEGEVRRPAVRELAEHSPFTIHSATCPYLLRVGDRLEDRTLWFCILCRTRLPRPTVVATNTVWRSLPFPRARTPSLGRLTSTGTPALMRWGRSLPNVACVTSGSAPCSAGPI